MCVCVCVCVDMYVYIYIYIYMYVYTHTYMYIYTYTPHIHSSIEGYLRCCYVFAIVNSAAVNIGCIYILKLVWGDFSN